MRRDDQRQTLLGRASLYYTRFACNKVNLSTHKPRQNQFDLHAINKMSHQLDVQRLEFAFQGRPDIIGAIQKAAGLTTIPKTESSEQPCKPLLSGMAQLLAVRVN
jgi:hypothetical protein